MNKLTMWGMVVIALLVGAYIGYAYEKNKFVGLMNNQQADYQRQLEEAKKSVQNMQPTVVVSDAVMMSKNGNYLTDAKEMTLYVYDKDTVGKSNCIETCAANWPPYILKGEAPSSIEHLKTIKRSDDSMQYAWDGKPLYYYVGDKKAGETKGDGVGGVWHLVK